jgi:SHS2 domain-containing protein
MAEIAGFFEHEHTADWELEIWAPDFFGLLEQAARGMYCLAGMCLAKEPRQTLYLDLSAFDREGLLVKFLTELLVLSEQEQLAFNRFLFSQKGTSLCVTLEGAPILSLDKEIKAVTYHNLAIRETEAGLRVNLVLDV